MTIPRLLGFAEYWKESPPVNELVAAYFKAEAGGESEMGNPEELLQMMPRKG